MDETAVLENVSDIQEESASDIQPEEPEVTTADESGEQTDERHEYIRSLQPQELLDLHPSLKRHISGLVGSLSDKQAKQRMANELPKIKASVREELLVEIRREQRYEHLREMQDIDPQEFIRAMNDPNDREIWASGGKSSGTVARGADPVQSRWEQEVGLPKYEALVALAPELGKRFDGKEWPPTEQGRADYEKFVDDLREEYINSEIERRLAPQKKKTATAERIDSLAEDADDAPDTASPSTRGATSRMTMAQFDAMPNYDRIKWRQANPQAYNEMIARTYARR